ncbi:MAG TPA: TolC family protein [Terriglobales bacterium]|nr:TolC family protein [Terriglobales bacterium]
MTKIGNLCIWLLLSGAGVAQSGTTSLQSLVAELRQSNPAVRASEAAIATARYAPKQASALPDTEMMVQHFSVGSPRPFAGYSNSDFAYIGFGASQELPYPGKRSLRASVAEHEVAISSAEKDAVAWDAVTSLKLAYLQLASSQKVISILQKDQQTAEQIVQSAEARYRVGQGAQEDVLRAQLQQTKLLNELSMQRRENAQAQAAIKALLNRPIGSPDILAEPTHERQLPPTETLLQKLADKNPDLQVSAQRIAQGHAAVTLAEREKKPDFGIQYMWQHTASEFRDYYMATFSIKLPNRSRVRAMEGEAQAKVAQAESERQARLKQIEGDLGEQIAIAQTAEQQLKVYDDGLIPQSEAALSAGLAGYSAGKQEYQGLLASFTDTLQLAIERERTLAEHEAAIARIEGLIGEELQ